MTVGFPFSPGRKVDRSINEILLARRDASPKEPAEAAQSFIYVLARELLRCEARPDRAEQVVSDFEEAARALTDAATSGSTVEEQAKILQAYWKRFELPAGDLRKRRKVRGPTDAQLRKEFEALRGQLVPILRDRKHKPHHEIIDRLRELAPWATPKKLETAAKTGPVGAAHVLLGSRYALGRDTVRNRISRSKNRN